MNDRYKGRQSTCDPAVEQRLFPKRAGKDPVLEKSLSGKVDLLRVRDARKAFRRRYASRVNTDKIFDQFDKDGKGNVNAYDIQEYAKKINLTISLNEA